MRNATQEEVLRLFEYRDGVLYWKERPRCSRKPPGDMSAGFESTQGYKKVKFNKETYYVHQIVFLMHHGYIPEVVDHIDRNTSNNRIENLRPANKSLNAFNSKPKTTNSSGYKNVTWNKQIKKWQVQLTINKRCKHFGWFDDLDFAGLLADEARRLYHGEYASI
jgi:hypothetical protein